MPVSNLNFAAEIERWAEKTEAQLTAIFRQSAQDVIEVMQEVGPSKANPDSTGTGRMPVDTGFLRASLVVVLNGDLPPADRKAPRRRKKSEGPIPWDVSAATLVINQANIGDRVSAGFTANYANLVNYGSSNFPGYHFVEYASGQWQQIVRRNVERAKGMVA